jgi:hypothetical protein
MKNAKYDENNFNVLGLALMIRCSCSVGNLPSEVFADVVVSEFVHFLC